MSRSPSVRRVAGAVRDLREVVVVLAVAAAVEMSLRRTSLPVTASRLGVALDVVGATPVDGTPDAQRPLPVTARRQVRAVHLVIGHWPFGDTCLRRCLVLGQRLRRLHPVLVVGTRRTPQGSVAVHSWLVVAGRSLDPTSGEFLPLRGRR